MVFARNKNNTSSVNRRYQSRLNKRERWKNLRTTVLMSVLTAGLLGGIFYWGVPFFIRMANWWVDRQITSSVPTNSDTIVPSTPRILLPGKVTKETKIEVKGFAEPDSVVTVYMNGEALKQVVCETSGQFLISDVILSEGDNVFTGTATDKANNTSPKSDPVTMTLDNTPPKLEVETPADSSTYRGSDKQTLEIKGTVEEESRLWINDRLVILGPQGRFVSTFRLAQGSQDINIKAVDQAGNETVITKTVTFEP